MINCVLYQPDGRFEQGDQSLILQWQQQSESKLWVDMQFATDEEIQWLTRLGCNSSSISEALSYRHPPKIEAYDEHLFIIYRGVKAIDAALEFEHVQIALFFNHRLMVSFCQQGCLATTKLPTELAVKYLSKGCNHLALKIFYQSSGYYLDSLLGFEQSLETIEDKFAIAPDDNLMKDLTFYKNKLTKVKRIFSYHVTIAEELVNMVEDDDTEFITAVNSILVNELKERLTRLYTLSQMYYDICDGMINGYISVSAHQLNTTMRILTVTTAIFVPITFLAGIYGMNFEYIPELKWHYGYFGLLGVMLLIVITLLIIFKKNKWL